jgi:hypothetical protein
MVSKRWIMMAMAVVFVGAVMLAVGKVRSPLVKFDRIAVGMSQEEVDRLLGRHPDHVGKNLTAYELDFYDLDIWWADGKVSSKRIQFRLPWVPADEKYGQTFAF